MSLHEFLDFEYGPDGDAVLRRALADGADPEARAGPRSETLLHVATRRCRPGAVAILLDHGADVNARTAGGKTAYAHAVRRGFGDVAELLRGRGADVTLTDADRLAEAMVSGPFDEARAMLMAHPELARTGNPEEDRLLADVAGRDEAERVALLIAAGADLSARGLDSGTPLHQAAWFGQPVNARLLIDAGAPLDVFEETHGSSPLHWAVHGSRYSGGAAGRQERYVAVTRMLLEAGSSLHYPDDPGGSAYVERLLGEATPAVEEVLRAALGS